MSQIINQQNIFLLLNKRYTDVLLIVFVLFYNDAYHLEIKRKVSCFAFLRKMSCKYLMQEHANFTHCLHGHYMMS